MFFSSITKVIVAPAVIGAALIAFAQLPDTSGEPPKAAVTAGGLVLASDPTESQDAAATATISRTEAAPAVIISSEGGSVLTADALRLHVADRSGAESDPLRKPLERATPPDVDVATSDMLSKYYELRARANVIRQDAKRMEIEAYAGGEYGGAGRETLLNRAKQRELEADIIDLRAESELFSSQAKLLRERSEQGETVPSQTDASATPPATAAPDVPGAMPPRSDARTTDMIQPGDRLVIEVLGGQPPQPEVPVLNGAYTVEASGSVALGAAYGRVPIAGLPLENAEIVIKNHLRKYVENPQVQVTQAGKDASETQLQSLRAEVRDLRAELEALRGGSDSGDLDGGGGFF